MIRFAVLGPLTVWRDGSEVALGAQMHRRLLAVLLARGNRLVSLDDLIAALWGEAAPPGARKTVQIYVHRLRQALGHDDRICSEHGAYQLRVTPDDLDADQFRILVARARSLLQAGSGGEAVQQFEKALGLWRGAAYEGVNERPPTADEARRLDEEQVRVTSEQIEARLALGHHEDLIPRLAALTERHPYHEDLRRHLMLALYRCGRQAEALEVYHRTRKTLDEELGLEPGPALRRMHEAILRSAPELELTQVDATPPRVVPRELPSAPAGFAGRTAQLSTLDKIALGGAKAGAVPIALISGGGGVGKTALVLHWAHRMAHEFPDGQLFIDLRGYSTGTRRRPIEALTALLRSLGVPPRRIPIDQAEAAALYRSQLADRRMLVVLDNARSAEEVRALLPGSPSSVVIVTGRDRLGGLVARDGAVRVPLDVLSPDETVTLIGELLDDAQRDSAEFAALAQACAHLPLAVRIAVAHLLDHPHQTVGQLVAKLRAGQRLQTLTVIGDDGAAVRSTFELSYQAVPPEARLLFRHVGVAPCYDFTAESAGALIDLPETEAELVLERLADAHLVSTIAEGRYAIHDLLRDYAAEMSETDDPPEAREAAINRLRRLSIARSSAAALLLYPASYQPPPLSGTPSVGASFKDASQALAWLDAEHANLVALIRSDAFAAGDGTSWRLAYQLRGYFDHRRQMVPWFAAARAGLWVARKSGDDHAQAAMLLLLSHAYGAIGRYDVATRNAELAVVLAERCGWTDGLAIGLSNLGVIHGYRGRHGISLPLFRRSFALFKEMGYVGAATKNLVGLATSHRLMGDLKQAVEVSREAIDAMSGSPYYPAVLNLGCALSMLGQYEEAQRELDRAFEGLRAVGHRPLEAYALFNLAEAFIDLARWQEAGEAAARGVNIARDIALPDALCGGLIALGRYFHATGDDPAAERSFSEAISTGALGFYPTMALVELARTKLTTGDLTAALSALEQALDLCAESQLRLCQGKALVVLAQVRLAQGEKAAALNLASEALAIQRGTGHLLGQAEALAVLGACDPDPARAAEHRAAARHIYQQTGTVPVRGLPL